MYRISVFVYLNISNNNISQKAEITLYYVILGKWRPFVRPSTNEVDLRFKKVGESSCREFLNIHLKTVGLQRHIY